MNILGQEISKETAAELERIYDHIGHKVDYVPLPLDNPIGFGRADWTTAPNWTVSSVTDLPQHYFEANLLHEHYHLCQIAEGFPRTNTKIIPGISSTDQQAIDTAGGALTSVIFDLDVCDRIAAFGLDSDHFFNVRNQQALKFGLPIGNISRPNKVLFTVRTAGLILQNPTWQVNMILPRFRAQNRQITQRAENLANRIRKLDHSTPLGCFECLVIGYDYLSLWDWQLIRFHDHIFTSHEQAHTFLSSYHQDSM